MKILNLKLNEKTYMSGKISLYLTKEALKIQREALAMGEKAKRIKNTEEDTDASPEVNIEEAAAMLDSLFELSDRKVWLLCEVYENKFTPDELEKGLSGEEIDKAVNMIIGGASGVIEKN